jgi:hypothetical protein
VGNAIDHVVALLRTHWDRNPGWNPRVVDRTKPDITTTMIDERTAPKTKGANRAGILRTSCGQWMRSAVAYKPTPKTTCVMRLWMRPADGWPVRLPAMPRPMLG